MQALRSGEPVGVLGGGAMGTGIAQVAAVAGHPVVVLDVQRSRAEAALDRVRSAMEGQVARGRLDASAAACASDGLSATVAVADLRDCGLVVEAAVEALEVKRSLLRDVEAAVGADCLLTTNTSSLSVDAIAAGLVDPSRLVGMHFFNPAPVMRLVEVVHGLLADPAIVERVEATARAWGKSTVRCASSPGFVVNRVARPFYAEALDLLAETGLEPEAVDRLFRDAGGFRMGPLEVVDLVGQDVNQAVTRSVWEALDHDPRNRPSALQRALVDAGRLGRKTGRGFYRHPHSPAPAPALPEPAPDGTSLAVGPRSLLRPLLDRTGLPLVDQADLDVWAALPDGSVCGLTRGEPAVVASARLGRPVVLLDVALDLGRTSRVGASDSADGEHVSVLADVLARAEVAVTPLPDTAGLLLARTIVLLVDEAVDLAARQGLAPDVLDHAVQLGLGYPRGPLAWGDALGPDWVVEVLDALERFRPGGRYRVSSALRRAALRGQALSRA